MSRERSPTVRRLENAGLLIFTAIFAFVLARNANTGGRTVPRTFLMAMDTNGFPTFHGVSLANPILRGCVFRWISIVGGEIDFSLPPKGWRLMTSAAYRTNSLATAEELNKLVLSPGAKAIKWRQQHQAGHP